MELALTGEKSFAQHALRTHQRAALYEVLLIGDQDIPDQVGVVEQVDSLVANLEENDVAVFLRRLDHERKTPPEKLQHHVAREAGARAWRGPLIWSRSWHQKNGIVATGAISPSHH